MTVSDTQTRTPTKKRLSKGAVAGVIVAIVVVAGMILDTKFISGDEDAAGQQTFSATEWAEENYGDVIEPWIIDNAVEAVELQGAIATDADAAGEEFGGRSGATSAWAFPVEFSGVAGETNAINGQMAVEVEGMPDDMQVFVQMGPAISGQALRDVTSQVEFGMFTNQIEFQTVAVELNNKVKETLLADLDAAALEGKSVDVVGTFSYSSATPKKWLVVPVKLEVVS